MCVFSTNTGPHSAQLQVYLADPDKRARFDRGEGEKAVREQINSP
jgi:hypothetical protein